jgi:hypothetical protein
MRQQGVEILPEPAGVAAGAQLSSRHRLVEQLTYFSGDAGDDEAIEKTGKVQFVADLAREYGFTDVDGRQPPRFNLFG